MGDATPCRLSVYIMAPWPIYLSSLTFDTPPSLLRWLIGPSDMTSGQQIATCHPCLREPHCLGGRPRAPMFIQKTYASPKNLCTHSRRLHPEAVNGTDVYAHSTLTKGGSFPCRVQYLSKIWSLFSLFFPFYVFCGVGVVDGYSFYVFIWFVSLFRRNPFFLNPDYFFFFESVSFFIHFF